ncbi:MAG: RNA polymerase III subunit C82 [Trizodia sp. TS-e1964]|nr:MAG: RNA polymerase III subunit C82 [Trizodia sp. TS-e1964]
MSQHAAELSILLVKDVYGDLSSRIFAALLQRGRLSLHALSTEARLSLRQLKHGLVVLIQQHLVLHYDSPDDRSTYYEADLTAAYHLIRSGKAIQLVEERFGEIAATLVQNVLLLGHAQLADLANAYGVGSSVGEKDVGVKGQLNMSGSTKGHHEQPTTDGISSLQQLHSIINHLLHAGFLIQTNRHTFQPLADNYEEAEILIRSAAGRNEFGTAKGKEFLRTKVREKLREWRDGTESKNLSNGSTSRGGKRQKLSHGRTFGAIENWDDDDVSDAQDARVILDEKIVVRFNFEKLAVALRNQQLVGICEKKIGEVTAQVYAELLRRLEMKLPRCHDSLEASDDTQDPPSITTLELSQSLDKDLELVSAIGVVPLPNKLKSLGRAAKRRKHPFIDSEAIPDRRDNSATEDEEEDDETDDQLKAETLNSIDESDDYISEDDFVNGTDGHSKADKKNRMASIKSHLQLLAESSWHFLRLVGSRGLGDWAVDFSSLTKRLKQQSLEDIITQRFNSDACRLVRILNEKGKLDEKQILNLSLLKQKDIRSNLTLLHEGGHLELQEVPRDATRQPSRTIYLWYFDPDKCRQLVLEDVFQTMARCLQRAETERNSMRQLLVKAERTDVVGQEDKYLSPQERMQLQKWKEKDEKLLGQMGRLDQLGFDYTVLQDCKLVAAAPEGKCTFELLVTEKYANMRGMLHGGAAALIFDMCTAVAVGPVARPGTWGFLGGVSRALNISYLKPVPIGTTLRIECEVLHLGRKLSLLRGVMTSLDGKVVYATAEHHKAQVEDSVRGGIPVLGERVGGEKKLGSKL